jgi:hypothetical protein
MRWLAVVEDWLPDSHVHNILRQTHVEDVAYCDEVHAWYAIAGPRMRAALSKWLVGVPDAAT